MALPTQPPDNSSAPLPSRGLPVSFSQPGRPPGEDGVEHAALHATEHPEGVDDYSIERPGIDFLSVVRQAEQQAQLYMAQVNRRAWAQSYRAHHNEHFIGSKYTKPEWRNRSRLFVPKTRTAVRKDLATVAASLFNSIKAIDCLPGNDGDPRQRGAAALMEQIVNYRTDRTSGKNAFPWFLVALGSRMDADLTGICVTKQEWENKFRKVREDAYLDDESGETRVKQQFEMLVDRPDMKLYPPENVIIHTGASWLNPAQSAAFLILKSPMTFDEIRAKEDDPFKPWHHLSDAELRGASNLGKMDMEAIRRARESGLDRYDETQTGTQFQVVWVCETFVRMNNEDWTFYSVGDQYYLTDPRPTREVYPEQDGERPVTIGYGSLESHRIFPMSSVESWQPLQIETNDLRNLQLDSFKQNVMPVTKVVRGKRIDLDQVKRRSSGSAIMVDNKDDVIFETPPQVANASIQMSNELNLELDDLAGQQNYGSVETNNALGKTLGGLKLAAGAANAVAEFDVRVWIETWANNALAQIVKLEQYYESDQTVLELCGQRAQLWEKHGINQIDDDLIDSQVGIRVSVGLGAGDPQQRLAKFQSAMQVFAPLAAQSQEFQSGQFEPDIQAIGDEVFGAVGYQDGGKRFIKVNPGPRPNPMGDLQTQKLQAEIEQRQRQGKGALLTGLANVAKVELGQKDLETQTVDMLLGHQRDARAAGATDGHQRNTAHLAAMEHGHRHGMAIRHHGLEIAKHLHGVQSDALNAAEEQVGGDATNGGEAPAPSPPSGAPSTPASSASPPPLHPEIADMLRKGEIEASHDPNSGQLVLRAARKGKK